MVPKLFVFSKIFDFCIFIACLVNWRNARVLYKIKRKFAFFGEYQIRGLSQKYVDICDKTVICL